MDIHILAKEELNDETFPLLLKATVATALWICTPFCQGFRLSSRSRKEKRSTHNRLHQENMVRSLPLRTGLDLNVVLGDTQI